jgi:sortase B
VVVQSGNGDPNYYLDKDLNLDYSKAGTLFIDEHSSIENKTQNIVIHGHNMVSTVEKMFHFMLKYKRKSYYQEHPLITFDSIYNTGEWKVFAVFITNGSSKKEPLFDYTRSTFTGSSDFLNFLYQIKIRSVLNIDDVDLNENDQLLMLSTCSYEADNYRTVVVARKVRLINT